MRCDEIAALLPSLVDGVDETNLVAERHVQECLRCQADLVRYRKLVRNLELLRTRYVEPTPGLLGDTLAALTDAAERLFAIADEPAPPDEGREAEPLAKALVLDGVRATYLDGREGLRGVSLTVPAGARVALVGASGAGKTTLFSVLLGFLPASGGTVRWDGVPLSELKPSCVRAQMAWVPQEPVPF